MEQNLLRKKALMDQLGGEEPHAGIDLGQYGEPGGFTGRPGGMPGTPGNPNTGIGGGQALSLDASAAVKDAFSPKAPSAEPVAPIPAAPNYKKVGQYANREAYNSDKLNRNWDDMSEKYQIGTVLSHFDPNQGFTPDVLAALNGANIKGAKFSTAGGDKLTVDNAGGWDRFGQGGTSDSIIGLKSGGNAKWGAWTDPNLQEQQVEMPQGGGVGGESFGGYQLDQALSGDPLAKIQQLIAQMSGSRPNFDALMAQLGQE